MALTEQNKIAIAEIAVYFPAFFLAIFLAFKHGFKRSGGFIYMVVFSLIRIIGACMQVATISQPKSLSLYIGAATLQNVGLSPLILVQVAFLTRALISIERAQSAILNQRSLRFVQLIVLIGLILGAVGGSNSGNDYADTGVWETSTLSQAGIALMIVGYIFTVLAAIIIGTQISAAAPGEKRVVLIVALSLPFILVRLAYSAESVYGSNPDFNQVTGNPDILLGMAIIMEMIVVAIVEGIGLTLQKMPETKPLSSSGSSEGFLGGFGGRRARRQQRRAERHQMGGFEPSRV
ncbi:hypothetical protein F5Y15DRAFT_378745 [Xylariaceae sp. FL0016]|nr:hypothetical protein F5Y15DRAFT_378745 [Xylariaceae sp. FL0016]